MTTPTTETGIVDKVARAICYWADPATNGSCHDNFCVGECRAVRPEKQHYDQARAAIAAMPDSTQLLQTMAGALERIAQPVYVAEPARKADSAWRVALGERIEIARDALAQLRAQEQRS